MAANSRGTADVLPTFQRVVERQEERTDRSLTQFSKNKSQAVHAGRKTPGNGRGGSLSAQGVALLKKPWACGGQ